jgi:hypothetical protein
MIIIWRGVGEDQINFALGLKSLYTTSWSHSVTLARQVRALMLLGFFLLSSIAAL